MARLIQDTIRRALADELLFGKLQHGGKVTIDVDEAEKIVLKFEEEPAAVTDPVTASRSACARPPESKIRRPLLFRDPALLSPTHREDR